MTSKKIISGFIWSFGERLAAQIVTTVVTIILARLLSPDDYGIISIVMVLISLLDIFVSSGLVCSLIQKREVDELDFNTAFTISLSLASVLYFVLFWIAPLLAEYYGKPILTSVFRVMGIRLFFAALNSIQQAHIRRNMQFKRFFFSTSIGTVVSAFVGVGMAYCGYGVWALVGQYLTNTTMDTIILHITGGWKPRIQFSCQKAKQIWTFGWKVLFTQLVCGLEDNVRSLIVGKAFGTSELAYYDQGQKYPNILVANISSTVEKVMLPAFSKSQDNIDELRLMLRKTIRIGIFILAPVLIGFGVLAEQFVHIILSDKWSPVIPFIHIFCLSYLTRPLEVACRQALLALGKSKEVMYCIIVIDGTGLLFVIYSVVVLHNVLAIAFFSLITTLISIASFLLLTRKTIRYSFREQLYDFFPSIMIAMIMGGCVYFVGRTGTDSLLVLGSQIVVGIVVYIGEAALFRLEPFEILLNLIKGLGKNVLFKHKNKEK